MVYTVFKLINVCLPMCPMDARFIPEVDNGLGPYGYYGPYPLWYGMVWSGMVWYGMVWYGMVWYGVVLPCLIPCVVPYFTMFNTIF